MLARGQRNFEIALIPGVDACVRFPIDAQCWAPFQESAVDSLTVLFVYWQNLDMCMPTSAALSTKLEHERFTCI